MKAIAVDFKDLWKIRHPINNCEGFQLNSFDTLIEVRTWTACANTSFVVWSATCYTMLGSRVR